MSSIQPPVPKPADHTIVAILAGAFDVSPLVIIEWLKQMDLGAVRRRYLSC
jgi:hypothetical protein